MSTPGALSENGNSQVDTSNEQSRKVLTPEEQEAKEAQKAKEDLERSEKTKKALEAQLGKLETLTPAGSSGRDILIRTLNQMIEKKGINGISFRKSPDDKIVPNVEKDGMNSLEQVNFIVTGAQPTERATAKQPDAFIDVNGDGQYIKGQDIGYFQGGKVEGTLDTNGNVLDTGAKKDGRNVGEMNLSPEGHQLYKVSNNGYFRDINTFVKTFGIQLGIPDASLAKLQGGSVVGPDDKGVISYQKGVPGKGTLEQQWVNAVNSPKMSGKKQIDITSFMEALQAQEAPKSEPAKPAEVQKPAENKDIQKPTGEFGRFYMDGGTEHYDIPDDAEVTYKKTGDSGTSTHKGSEIELTAENLKNEKDGNAKFTRISNGDSMILIGEGGEDLKGKSADEVKKILTERKGIEAWEVKKEGGKPAQQSGETNGKADEKVANKMTITEIGDKEAHSMTVVNSSERGKDKSHPIRMEEKNGTYTYTTKEGGKNESSLNLTKDDIDAIKKDPKTVPNSIKTQITNSLGKENTPLLSGDSLHLQIPEEGGGQRIISIKKGANNELSIETEVSNDPRINFPAMKSISADKKTMTLHSIGGRPEIQVKIGDKGEVQVIGKDNKPYAIGGTSVKNLTDFFGKNQKQALRDIVSTYEKSSKVPSTGDVAKGTPTQPQTEKTEATITPPARNIDTASDASGANSLNGEIPQGKGVGETSQEVTPKQSGAVPEQTNNEYPQDVLDWFNSKNGEEIPGIQGLAFPGKDGKVNVNGVDYTVVEKIQKHRQAPHQYTIQDDKGNQYLYLMPGFALSENVKPRLKKIAN